MQSSICWFVYANINLRKSAIYLSGEMDSSLQFFATLLSNQPKPNKDIYVTHAE